MMKLLDESWKTINNLVVYGFGKSGQTNVNMFLKEFHVAYIIDNNVVFQGRTYQGIPIINEEEYKNVQKIDDKIVIIASGESYISIRNSLHKLGKREEKDYVGMDRFLTGWYWSFQRKICIGRVTMSVTTKCTFNCKYCNMFMPYFNDSSFFSLDMLCRDADALFEMIDYVASYTIVGGEPFLHQELFQYLDYVGERYRNRIGNIQLITNGTILPDQRTLDTIKKWKAEVRVSDYTKAVPYQKKINEFLELLKHNGIDYRVFEQEEWLDFGLPNEKIDMGSTREELRAHMLNCNSMCHLVHDGYYYFCSRSWCAEQVGVFQLTDGDKINLLELKNTPMGKEKIMEFHMGNLQNGYLSYCKVCRGYQTHKSVRAGEQLAKTQKRECKEDGGARGCIN